MDKTEYTLKKLSNFQPRPGPLLVVIMDGVGIGKHDKGDAFYAAQPSNLLRWMDEAKKQNLFTQLKAHGPAVGLPTEEDMGNSEVGHNALGSGQIYNQGAKLVNESINTGKFFKTDNWQKIVTQTGKAGKTVHLLGLLSDGNVHSHISQVFKMLQGIVDSGVKRIRVHPLLDGRDVPPDSGLEFIGQLEKFLRDLESQHSVDAKIASGGGRMHVTMDRYESNWDIVRRGWETHVMGYVPIEEQINGYKGYYQSAKEAIEAARKIFPEKLDQYNPPFVVVDETNSPVGKMVDGDAVINFNYRGDRAIEISKAFLFGDEFKGFHRAYRPAVNYAGLLEYDTEEHIPPVYLVPPPDINYISSQYICNMGIKSYAIAETHKFGHVTYFWNGNRTGYINDKLEKFEEIKSEPNEMIEGHPEMRIYEVTDRLLEVLASKEYKYIRVNYANGDMVGHTGNFNSCIKAVKALDICLEKVVKATLDLKGMVIITADHGNVEEKLDKKGNVKTSHTLNPVPFFILDSQYAGEYTVDTTGITEPGISNVAASFINMLGYEAPSMYEKSLIKWKK
jgi:2,3-bisphosphoglycerate-independent phosphoglycerate mutase